MGKSTLFNRLIGQRQSIVSSEEGVTRDRIYGRFDWQGSAIMVSADKDGRYGGHPVHRWFLW